MPILQLTTIEQVILILLSILLSITVLFLLIVYKKYLYQNQHEWRDVEKDFVMIQGPDHMMAIKRSESSSLEAGRLTTQALLHQPILTSPNDSKSTLCPKSPPPVYYEMQHNNNNNTINTI
jgi:hypothetical protein